METDCPGVDNPVDLGSRGVTASQLKESELWWKGLKWLSGLQCDWPIPKEIKSTVESLAEVEITVLANTQVVDKDCVIKFGKFSNLERLIRVMAIFGRFVDNLTARVKHKTKTTETLKVSELIMAEQALSRIAQKELMERSDYEQLVKPYTIDLCI